MKGFRFEEQKTVSLRHKITDDIRMAIFNGMLKPGARLREVEIAKQMGVSRGPVREAMRTLEQEGLLHSHPYKETTVAEITSEEVTEVLIPIRLTIEDYALRKGLPVLGEQHYTELEKIIARMKEGAAERDISIMTECDLLFHEYLVNLSGMDNAIHIWKSIYNRIRLYMITQANAYPDLNVLVEEHKILLEAIKKGDQAKVSAALSAHIHTVNWSIMPNPDLK